MNTLKTNLRQEHWETLSWGSTCHQLLTPWQLATLLVEAHPQWSVPCVCPVTKPCLEATPALGLPLLLTSCSAPAAAHAAASNLVWQPPCMQNPIGVACHSLDECDVMLL